MRFPNGQEWVGSDHGYGIVDAVTDTEASHHADHEKSLYSWYSQFTTDAAEDFFYIQNDSEDYHLIVWEILMWAGTAAVIDMYRATSGTAAGTTVTPVNGHIGSGKTFSHTAYGNAEVTGSLSGNTLATIPLLALTPTIIPIHGMIVIPNGENLTFATLAAATTPTISLVGYFHEA